MTILVCDDDKEIVDAIEIYLIQEFSIDLLVRDIHFLCKNKQSFEN